MLPANTEVYNRLTQTWENAPTLLEAKNAFCFAKLGENWYFESMGEIRNPDNTLWDRTRSTAIFTRETGWIAKEESPRLRGELVCGALKFGDGSIKVIISGSSSTSKDI